MLKILNRIVAVLALTVLFGMFGLLFFPSDPPGGGELFIILVVGGYVVWIAAVLYGKLDSAAP
jgi:hypothetical protein